MFENELKQLGLIATGGMIANQIKFLSLIAIILSIVLIYL